MAKQHLDGGSRGPDEPAWHVFEAASAPGIAGSILRVEVAADEPEGATWLLSVFVDDQCSVISTGTAETVDLAKHAAWDALTELSHKHVLNA